MTKNYNCNCKSGCKSSRCSCLKNLEPCDDKCGCVECQNPLNGIDIEKYSTCALQNIGTVKNLSQEELDEEYELPCGCEKVKLKNWQHGTKTGGIRHRTEGESAGEGATGAAEKGEPGMKPKELKEVTGKLNTKDALFKAAKEYIRMYRTQKAGLK